MMSNRWMVRVAGVAISICLLVLGGYIVGYGRAKSRYQLEMAATKQQYTDAARASEQAYTAKLQAAAADKQKWYDFAQAQSIKLAAAYNRLDAQAENLKKDIPNAIQKDDATGRCYGGLGPDSLRLYRRALGYDD